MTEREYRELMGVSLHFSFLINGAKDSQTYIKASQILCDACTKMLHTLRTETDYQTVGLFTALPADKEDRTQLTIYFQEDDLRIGMFDQGMTEIVPYVDLERTTIDRLVLLSQALTQRCEQLAIWSPHLREHALPHVKQTWKRYLEKWPMLEQRYRSEWQIIDQISPQTQKAYVLVKDILDRSDAVYIENDVNGHNTIYMTANAKNLIDEARKQGRFEQLYLDMLQEQETMEHIKDKSDKTTLSRTRSIYQEWEERITPIMRTYNEIRDIMTNPLTMFDAEDHTAAIKQCIQDFERERSWLKEQSGIVIDEWRSLCEQTNCEVRDFCNTMRQELKRAGILRIERPAQKTR